MVTSTTERKRLGTILVEAGLLTPAQLEVALTNQQHFDYLIGEVIALHGWVKKDTVEFFAEHWNELVVRPNPLPIGHYLQMASLLEQQQIAEILAEQKKMGLRFGAMAVLKGWVKQQTMDFFLLNLKSNMSQRSAFQTHQVDLAVLEKIRAARNTKKTHNTDYRPKDTQAQKTRSQKTHAPLSETSSNGRSHIVISDSTIELPLELVGTNGQPLYSSAQDEENFDLASVLEMDDGNICF